MKYILLLLISFNVQAKDCNPYLGEGIAKNPPGTALLGFVEGMRAWQECRSEEKSRREPPKEQLRERINRKATYTTCHYNGPVVECTTF